MNFFQPYQSLHCSLYHLRVGSEDRFDLCTTRFGVLRHRHLLRLLQSKLILITLQQMRSIELTISIHFQLSSLLLGIHDPFIPFENVICAFLFGGVLDTLSKVFGNSSVKEGEKADAKKKD